MVSRVFNVDYLNPSNNLLARLKSRHFNLSTFRGMHRHRDLCLLTYHHFYRIYLHINTSLSESQYHVDYQTYQ